MNAITYFRLNSPYPGDVTKNCALTGSEVDNNFYTLEGRDIKSVELEDGKIVVNLMNGEKLTTDNITQNCITNIEFDEIHGVLTITQNDGNVKTISGFATNYNVGTETTSVNGSLIGNGLSKSPLGISPISKTGQYRPVKKIINIVENEKLPIKPNLFPGDRYLTIENINEYGYLYNYDGLKRIACRLKETNSEWRIPTKEDWDDMLDAVEPIDNFRNHTDVRSNKFLGKFAGKFLKSKEFWKKEPTCDCDDENNTCIAYPDDNCCEEECACGRHIPCNPNYCGEYGTCHHVHHFNNNGIDLFGFRAMPAGYANEAKDFMYFKERAYFWTATNHEYRDAYIKAFAYNKSSVLQDVMASDNFMSVRLVKNYNGENYIEREDILGNTYSTVMMPSMKHGTSIWTSVNLCMGDCECSCGCGCQYVLPNNGEGMEFTKKYFINEWTGRKWLRNELKDGESVVVVENDPNNYTEYRVVNGELVDVASLIYDKVIETLTPIKDELENEIQDLTERLNNEIERSTNKDNEHDEAINGIDTRLETVEEKVQENTNNIQTLTEHLEQTDANLTTLREDFTNAVEEINTAIEEEKTIRAEKDAQLEEAINAEQQARIEKDNELAQDIEDETSERLAEDTRLQEEIDTLEEITHESIANLDAKIEQEKQDRIAKDDEIEAKLITSEGTVFDTNSGILTLKSQDGTNDIKVQFNLNFGTF